MRHQIFATVLLAGVSAIAYGQNLNPTVEVTNAYEGGASSIVKPVQRMAVPDSVTTFNLDFDYSVFEKPYQGAYEFKPYHVQLRPRPVPSTENKFYLRAGAGFTLRPELDLVWTPLRKERGQIDVYAGHRSYFGRFHKFEQPTDQNMDGERFFKAEGGKMPGFLTDTRVGVDGSFGWENGLVTADVAWHNRLAQDDYLFRRMNGVETKARVRSLPTDAAHFLYDAAVDYHYRALDCSSNPLLLHPSPFTESRFDFDGTFGPVFNADNRLVVDLDMGIVRYGGDASGYTGGLSVTPKYEFSLDNWRFSLGAKVSTLIYSEDWTDGKVASQLVYPAVHVDLRLLDEQLILQAAATGGDRVNARSEAFMLRPFALFAGYDHSLERVRAMLGVRGNVASRFRYDLQGGYARWERAPLDGFFIDGRDGSYQPYIGQAAFNLLFAELDYGWKSESVTVDGKMAYRWTDVAEDNLFTPAAFTGWIRPAWHWGDRFTAGLDAAWSTRRTANYNHTAYVVPGWVDLGLFAEFNFTRHFGFWVKGGNLLNQTVQTMPLHSEAGMYVTGGILLNF